MRRIVLILSFVLTLLLASNAGQATFSSDSQVAANNNNYDAVCNERGSLWIKSVPRSFVKEKGIVEIKYLEKDEFITINGTFINYLGQVAKLNDNYIGFVSQEGMLKQKGTYTVLMIYPEEEEKNGDMQSVSCPGFTFSCKEINLKINDCYTTIDGQFVLMFNASGLNQGIELNLTKDILYDIKGTKRTWSENYPPQDMIVYNTGGNTYKATFYANNTFIKSIRIRIKGCDEIFNTPSNLYAHPNTIDSESKCRNISDIEIEPEVEIKPEPVNEKDEKVITEIKLNQSNATNKMEKSEVEIKTRTGNEEQGFFSKIINSILSWFKKE
jgi:hypothetical protein